MLAPTLIVGLGGVGGQIVKQVCLQTSEEKRKRVKFVAIDTDVNDLRKLKDEVPQIQTIQTSAPYTVGEYLYNNTTARDTWFPTHHILMGKTPTEGAGQVRAISRLAFDTALREGRMRPLEKAIEDLYTLDGEGVQQALRVIVVASLAGGTGSGIILPASVYIKYFLEKRLKRSACVMRGFLLLPDVFFSGKGPEEINNLSCNGYASLRELDAFMRRSDNEDDDSGMFREMTLLMPDTTTGEYVDYKNAPFNFCFLFGAQNTADQDLRSFEEYKAQAASIVYAQAVSALSGRSNSNEDNTILTLCSGSGHNRFCGAGSSRMFYPKNDVVRYLADQWALKGMGEDWLAVDEDYKKYCKRQEDLQERDPSVEIMPLPEFYLQTVDGKAEANAFFARIQNNCTVQTTDDDGRKGNWVKYLEELVGAIDAAIGRQGDFNELNSIVSNDIGPLENAGMENVEQLRNSLYEHLIDLAKHARGCANLAAADVINNVLLQDGDLTGTTDQRNLEFWLKDTKKRFLHPAAVRYFLCGLSVELDGRVKEAEECVYTLRHQKNPLITLLDDPETSQEEGINEYAVTKTFLKLREVVDTDQVDQLVDECKKYQKLIYQDFSETTRLLVLQETQRMVQRLLDGFHMFFDTLRTCLEKTARESADLHS